MSIATGVAALKIVIVRNSLTSLGGAERYTLNLLEQLVRLGHEVHVFTASAPPLQPEVTVHFMPTTARRVWRLAGLKIKGPRPPRLQQHLANEAWYRQEVLATAPDLLLSMEKLLPCDVFRAGGGVHRVWWNICLRNATPLRRFFMKRDRLHSTVLATEEQLLNPLQTRALICNSHMVADEAKRVYGYPPEQTYVLHNGVNLDNFQPANAHRRGELRARRGVPEGEAVLLFAGSGFWRKGLDIALEIAAHLHRLDQPFRFFVVGRGENRAMQKLAQKLGIGDKVVFVGQIPTAEMLEWYQMSDLFLFPSRYDPFANACLEAAACGLPVLTGQGNGFKEVLRDGENGLVLGAAETPAEAAGRLQQFLQQLPERETVRQSVAHLELGGHVESLVALLQDLGPRPGGWA